MSEQVIMTIGDREFDGWTSVRISDSLERESPEFTISVSDRGGVGSDVRTRPIEAGQLCVIRCAGDRLVTGFVDSLSVSISATSHTLTVQGAGKTADLVDSAAIFESGEFRNYDLASIANTLCKPFGIGVRTMDDVGPKFEVESINPGEKIAEFLGRLAAKRGLLVFGDQKGDLVIGRMENERIDTELNVECGRILSMSAESSQADRFHEYIVQTQQTGNDQRTGENITQIEARSQDNGVARTGRKLLIVSESAGDQMSAKTRADWERRVRIGKGIRAQVQLQGWRRPDGALWRKGIILPVDIPVLPSARDLVVSGVEYSFDNSGAKTNLTLVPMDALLPEPDGEFDEAWAAQLGEKPPVWSGQAGR